MRRLRQIAAFVIAAVVAGIIAMELQTRWINPALTFWEGRGSAWVAGAIQYAIVLAVAALLLHGFKRFSPKFLTNAFFGALANLSLALLLSLIDDDRLLRAPVELLSAIAWGAVAGLLWYATKRLIVVPSEPSAI